MGPMLIDSLTQKSFVEWYLMSFLFVCFPSMVFLHTLFTYLFLFLKMEECSYSSIQLLCLFKDLYHLLVSLGGSQVFSQRQPRYS